MKKTKLVFLPYIYTVVSNTAPILLYQVWSVSVNQRTCQTPAVIPSNCISYQTLAVLMIRSGLISASRLSVCALKSPESNSISGISSDASKAVTSSSASSSKLIKPKSPSEKTRWGFSLSSSSKETFLVSSWWSMLASKYRPQLLFCKKSGLLLLDLTLLFGWWSLHLDPCGHSPVASKTGHT